MDPRNLGERLEATDAIDRVAGPVHGEGHRHPAQRSRQGCAARRVAGAPTASGAHGPADRVLDQRLRAGPGGRARSPTGGRRPGRHRCRHRAADGDHRAGRLVGPGPTRTSLRHRPRRRQCDRHGPLRPVLPRPPPRPPSGRRGARPGSARRRPPPVASSAATSPTAVPQASTGRRRRRRPRTGPTSRPTARSPDGRAHAGSPRRRTHSPPLEGDSGPVALFDRCSHLGGPLHEGVLVDGCVRCPWHGSTFRMDDGTVVRGPATATQPAYELRVDGDRIQARRRTVH